MQRLSIHVECWSFNDLGRVFKASSSLRSVILSLAVLPALSLTGCGGGGSNGNTSGGGGGGKTTPPPPASYSIGGTTSGLSGTGLVLQDNGGDSLAVSANGIFTFTTPITNGGAYNVSVLTQPANPSQSCVVTNGQGTATATVTSVLVTCTTNAVPTYSIGGTVSGLSGSGLVLEDNSSDDLPVTANGVFTFATKISAGGTYIVTVKTQPSNPIQTCSVTNNTGAASANVSNVAITCSTTTFTIGGTLSGLTNGSVVLQDNNTDNLSLSVEREVHISYADCIGCNLQRQGSDAAIETILLHIEWHRNGQRCCDEYFGRLRSYERYSNYSILLRSRFSSDWLDLAGNRRTGSHCNSWRPAPLGR